MKRVAVIGAGLGGLAAAIRLAVKGWQVDVYEQQERCGGKANVLEGGGFRFDSGPSLVTMKEVFDDLFHFAGEKTQDHTGFIPLTLVCHYFYPDGTFLKAYAGRDNLAGELAEKTAEDSVRVNQYLKYAARIYHYEGDLFLKYSLHERATYTGKKARQAIAGLFYLDLLRTMDQANRSFFKDKRVVQLFNRYTTYNGSSPYKVPATLNLIPHVEFNQNAYAMAKGIYSIPKALEGIVKKHGGRFFYKSKVERITHSADTISGILTQGEYLKYPVVVSNCDVSVTYKHLLQDQKNHYYRRYQKLEPSSSGGCVLLGRGWRIPATIRKQHLFFNGL